MQVSSLACEGSDSIKQRSLKNACLSYLMLLDNADIINLCYNINHCFPDRHSELYFNLSTTIFTFLSVDIHFDYLQLPNTRSILIAIQSPPVEGFCHFFGSCFDLKHGSPIFRMFRKLVSVLDEKKPKTIM